MLWIMSTGFHTIILVSKYGITINLIVLLNTFSMMDGTPVDFIKLMIYNGTTIQQQEPKLLGLNHIKVIP